MILMEFLFAPTVPSEPKPQNLQAIVLSSVTSGSAPTSIDVMETSSIIPTVKWFFLLPFMLSNTATTCAGVTSLEDRPYLPANTKGVLPASINAEQTS